MTPSRLKIGLVVELLGVSVSTIKNYERDGRIPLAEGTRAMIHGLPGIWQRCVTHQRAKSAMPLPVSGHR